MREMKELENNKRKELYEGIIQLGVSSEKAKIIWNILEDECVIEITPPQMDESALQNIKLKEGHTALPRGISYKPGNIIFNIKASVIDSLSLGASIIVSIGAVSVNQPMIAIFTILTVVISVAKLGKITIKDDAALILSVLWKNVSINELSIEFEKGLKLINKYLEENNREKMMEMQYNDLIGYLEEIECLTVIDGRISLKEKICIEYK